MSIVEYNFSEFTDKDMFEMKLKDVVPDFGYISCTKRRPFFEFCVKHKFISAEPSKEKNGYGMYDVLINFRFAAMLGYRAKPVIFDPCGRIMVHPSYKMHNLVERGA